MARTFRGLGAETAVRLMTAHKILIGTASGFFLFFAAVQMFWMPGGRATPIPAALGLAASIVLGLYLVTLRGK